MDRNSLLAVLLIGLIMMVWMVWFSPAPPPPDPEMQPVPTDTQEVVLKAPVIEQPAEPDVFTTTDSTYLSVLQGEARLITVETDLYTAQFSTKGGTLTSFRLKKYFTHDRETPVQLVDTTHAGALSLVFTSSDSRLIDSRDLFFEVDVSDDKVDVKTEPATLTFTANLGQGMIRQTYTFRPATYEIGYAVTQPHAETFSAPDGYELVWNNGLPFSEKSAKQEAFSANASVRSGGEIETIDLTGDETQREVLGGKIEWVATRNGFFAAFMIPDGQTYTFTKGAELEGRRFGETDDPNLWEDYTTRILMPRPQGEADTFKLYLGPLDNQNLKAYKDLDLYGIVDYGFGKSITRPIAQYVIMPVFDLLSKFINNYGLIIILFTFLIKGVLYPLTKSSYKSMAKMRKVQPFMAEIKEKYGDNPKKQQEAMMKLYKQHGVNPLGGCLPMVFQMPILYALFRFFPSSIEIRQQGFLWATDLSAPDVIYELPFNIPMYGSHVAGFVLLMVVAMVFQMKIQQGNTTGGGGAQANQMKMMMYIMPVMLLVFFNTFAAGLSLYYLSYNVLTAVQQKLINRSIEAEDVASEAGPVKKGKKANVKARQNGQARKGKKKAGNRSSKTRR